MRSGRAFIGPAMVLSLGALAGPVQTAAAATCTPALSRLALERSTIAGGGSLAGQVTVSCAVQRPVTIRLTGFPAVKIPTTVKITRGGRTARFSVKALATSRSTTGRVSAALGRVRRTAKLTVTPGPCARPKLVSLALPARMHAGETPTGTVRLSCPPKAPGVTLSVSSSQAGRLTVPAKVTVPSGGTTAQVRLTTSVQGYSARYTARITATHGKTKVTRDVTVDPGLKYFELSSPDDPTNVYPSLGLTGPAPQGGTTVRVVSNSALVKVPATVRIPAGSYGITFSASSQPVTTPAPVSVTVSLGTRSLTGAGVLEPTPYDPGHLEITGPSDRMYGGETATFMATLSKPAPAGGIKVSLTSENGDPGLTVPESVTIPEGKTFAEFPVTAAEVTTTSGVQIEAWTAQRGVAVRITSFSLILQPRSS